ncbi:hypothetical protein CARUB_v10011416mg [Capsella rubella]|uniref:Hydroxyproline-rich glycoprotein family protein n=1 Tax=Capsella rubella TaxID=81985 RepID=R0GM84_9BRAS|nr:hypothetical protein CARUB_v10011416mg [Capsella rubella]
MASLSLLLRYVFVLSFFTLLNSNETLSSRLVRSSSKVALIRADDYPSTGRNSPVHDLGFPEFPSFQEAVAPPPPPPDMPLLPPPLPDMPLLPPPLPDMPPPPPPAFPYLEKPKFRVPVWPSLPDFPPFPFVDQAAPSDSEPSTPTFEESDSWMPSTPSIPQGFP